MAEPGSRPPRAFTAFSERFPKIAQAWDLLAQEGSGGPLELKAQRLVKLGVAMGARAEGATHSAVRKALAAGITPQEIYQAVALAASTIGLPGAVASFTWVEDELKKLK